jgi:DNA-binding MarR family transcriptional regulator
MPPSDSFVATLHQWTEIFMRHSMRDFIRYSKEKGLSMSQIGALFHINSGASGVSGLGDHLGVTNAAASQMLDRLFNLQLINRSEDPHDRRAKQIVLTDEGRRVLQESIQARQSWMDGLADTLSPDEKEQVTAALRLLIERTRQIEQEPEI